MELALLCVAWSLPQPWPDIQDVARFPPEAVAKAYCELAEKHVRWLEEQRPWHAHCVGDWDAWLWDARLCQAKWDALLRVHNCLEECRREQLDSLRWHLGLVDYHAGRMPPPVPVWRFQKN